MDKHDHILKYVLDEHDHILKCDPRYKKVADKPAVHGQGYKVLEMPWIVAVKSDCRCVKF
jgi:hypothetical protein